MSSKISDDDREYIKKFRQSEVYEKLFELLRGHIDESDKLPYDLTEIMTNPNGKFSEKDVSGESEKKIKLVERKESGHRTIVECTMEDKIIKEAHIDIGKQASPLMGRGYRIWYKDDEYTESRWVS